MINIETFHLKLDMDCTNKYLNIIICSPQQMIPLNILVIIKVKLCS